MDTADDIAYAIHDLEDVHRVGVLQQGAVAAELMAWQRCGAQTRRWAGPAARSSRCAASCTARTAGWPTTTRSPRPSSWSGPSWSTACWPRPFDGSLESEARVAAFSATWTRRLVESIEVTAEPAGPVRARRCSPRPSGTRCRSSSSSRTGSSCARPDLALHQRGQAPAAGVAGRGAAGLADRPGRDRTASRAGWPTWSSWPRPSWARAPRTGSTGPAAGGDRLRRRAHRQPGGRAAGGAGRPLPPALDGRLRAVGVSHRPCKRVIM